MDIYKIDQRTKDSGSAKLLLKKDLIPGIIYGKGTEPKKIVFDKKTLEKIMFSGSFYSKILNLEINGKKEKVLPKELQYHPVTDRLIHFDFLRVQDNTKVNVEVPVEFLNQDQCPGLKKGGVLNLVRRLVELVCNAIDIPEKLQFDLIDSDIGDAIKISNIELPENVKPSIADRDFVIATLVPPTIEIEPEPEAEDEEKEGEDEGEGEGVEGEVKEADKTEAEEEVKQGEAKAESKKEDTSENKSK